MRFKGKGVWLCSKDCEICEGKGYVETGMEGFVNSRMEQDCRETYGPCENAEWDEFVPDEDDDMPRERLMLEGEE